VSESVEWSVLGETVQYDQAEQNGLGIAANHLSRIACDGLSSFVSHVSMYPCIHVSIVT
jgi:hypothetical protein